MHQRPLLTTPFTFYEPFFMIYITGKKETVDHLMKMDEYHGSLTEYKKKLFSLNLHLTGLDDPEPYTPVCLLKDSSEEMQEIADELNDCIPEVREYLWKLQSEKRLDANAIEAVFETMDEYQDYQKNAVRRSISSIFKFLLFLLAFIAYVLIRQYLG